MNQRRNLLLKAPLGIGTVYVYGRLINTALSNVGISSPALHEDKIRQTVATALQTAATRDVTSLRVLEVGIGSDCRCERRGLYDNGLQYLSDETKVRKLEIVGIDLTLPSSANLQDAQERLSSASPSLDVSLEAVRGDITEQQPYPEGHFDAVLCFLTLCSVQDPALALSEISRLLRPSGGTFGYVEHVAAGSDDAFLDWQQKLFDPYQQLVADNCHLHRNTEESVESQFRTTGRWVAKEKFSVDDMWPVSCQTSGVVQRVSI